MEGTKYRQTMVGDEKQNGFVQTKKTKRTASACAVRREHCPCLQNAETKQKRK